jgi:hypothetical protein
MLKRSSTIDVDEYETMQSETEEKSEQVCFPPHQYESEINAANEARFLKATSLGPCL